MSSQTLVVALLAVVLGCRNEQPVRSHDELEGHAGAHDSAAADQELLAAARGKPAIITAADLSAELNLDESLNAKVTPHVELLNAALVEMVELQRQYGSGSSDKEKQELNRRASIAHLHADKHEDDLHNLLSPAQHEQFHKLLQERSAQFGLGIDEAHGDRLFGTAGSLYGVDTARTKRSTN